jgi:H+/Cl- antiporter ClcA
MGNGLNEKKPSPKPLAVIRSTLFSCRAGGLFRIRVTRLTIAATVMLLEATGNLQYVLPLSIAVFSARWFGNIFNEAIQDMQIVIKHLPFLHEEIKRDEFG